MRMPLTTSPADIVALHRCTAILYRASGTLAMQVSLGAALLAGQPCMRLFGDTGAMRQGGLGVQTMQLDARL